MFCDSLGNTCFGVSSNLPGLVQTVGSGEIFALVLLLRNLDYNAQVEFVTDNYNWFDIYHKGVNAAINSASCDLYKHIYQLIDSKHIQLSVRWMPSHLGHLEQDVRPSDVSHFDVLANDQADFHAGEAASRAQIPKDYGFKHISNIDLA